MANWAAWRDYLRLAYAEDAFIAFGLCLVIAVTANLIARQGLRTHLQVAMLLFGVAMLGATAGFAGGMSREAAVGSIIPAALTLVGGISVYLFGADNTRGAAVSLTAACFALALFLGYSSSSQLRAIGDEFRDLRDRCVAAYVDPDLLKDAATFERFEAAMGSKCAAGLKWAGS